MAHVAQMALVIKKGLDHCLLLPELNLSLLSWVLGQFDILAPVAQMAYVLRKGPGL